MHTIKKAYNDAKYIKQNLALLNEIVERNFINLTGQKSMQVISAVEEMMMDVPVQTTITLHAWNLLIPLLRGIKQAFDRTKEVQSLKTLRFIIQRMYINTYDCFLQHELSPPHNQKFQFDQIFSGPRFKQIFEQSQRDSKFLQEDERSQIFKDLLTRYYKIQKIKQKIDLRKDINLYLEEKLLPRQPTSFLEEICLNFIKMKVQITQNQEKYYLCCRIHFERATTSLLTGYSQTVNQQFKDYRWPLQNQSIRFHLTKTLVGFLNTQGGIIYVGLKEDKSKKVEIKGIELSHAEKKAFLYFIHDNITKQIYPKAADREEYQQKMDQNHHYRKRIQQEFDKQISGINGYEYHIDDYITVDFMDVFEGKTLLNSIGSNNRLYVIRIKIKAGDPRQLYHVISTTKNVPEAFLRQDKSVKKKDMKQFHELFYKKISGQDIKSKPEKNDPHSLCRFNPNPPFIKK